MSVDATAIVAAGVVAYFCWAWPVYRQPGLPYFDGLFFVPLLFISFFTGGLYPGFGLGAVETLRRITLRVTFLFIVLTSTSFALRLPHHYSRATVGIAWMAALVLVPALRFAFLKIAHRWDWWSEPVIVVGSGEIARRTVQGLASALSLGYRPIAVLALADGGSASSMEGVPIIGPTASLPDTGAFHVRIAMVADESVANHGELVATLQRRFRHVIHVRGYEDLPVEGVQVRNLGGVLGIEFNNQLLLPGNRFLKRATDVIIGSLASLAALPLIAIAAALVKITAPGPVFFIQQREGLYGHTIRVRKLRTMFVDAEERLEQHLADDPSARVEWDERCKLRDDPRVIPVVGRFLRRFSLDELPQLFQVVTGEMSLVGPRPFPAYHLERFEPEFRALRRQVRPGVTGLWQVMARSDGTLEDQRAYDTYYIRNWSLWMDVYVLARTASVVIFGKGAY